MRQLLMEKNCQTQLKPRKDVVNKYKLHLRNKTIAIVFTLVVAVLLAFPQNLAFAEYENLSITGIAQVKTDASLHVTEQRAFSFDESYSAIVWNVPGIRDESLISVSSVRALQANKEGKSTGKWRAFKEVPFNQSWRNLVTRTGGITKVMGEYFDGVDRSNSKEFITKPKSRTYSFDSTNDNIYIFPKNVKKTTVYECNYNISKALRVYDDVAELYWTYSNPVDDDVARDIRMKIQLPVPEKAEVLPNENVFAWGHGPQGSLDIRSDGVIDIKVPEVRTGQYSMVHVVFPRSWLRNVNMKSDVYHTGTRLGYALDEEDGWTDTHSSYVFNNYAIILFLLGLSFISVVVSILLYLIYGREKKPSELEDYCFGSLANAEDAEAFLENRAQNCEACEGSIRGENPAICGRLLRWNRHSAYDLAYVLQGLCDKGVVQITLSSDPGKIRFRLAPSTKNVQLDDIEQGALYLFFEEIGDGYQSISIDDISQYCAKNSNAAYLAMRKWQDIVSKHIDKADVFDIKSRGASYIVYGIAAFMAVVGIGSLVFGLSIWGAIASFVASATCITIAYNMPRRTQKGVDLANKLENCEPLRSSQRPLWEEPLANAFGKVLTA